jgi:predicted Zn-dependent protease
LSKREAAAVKPQRIRLHTVRPGESAADIAEHMSVESARLEHLLVLNGLSSGREVKPGDVMKIISDD